MGKGVPGGRANPRLFRGRGRHPAPPFAPNRLPSVSPRRATRARYTPDMRRAVSRCRPQRSYALPMVPPVLAHSGIEYVVTRKRVKNVRITIKAPAGEVRVTAPPHVPERDIAAFVASKARWIETHRQRIALQPPPLGAGPEANRLRRELRRAIPPLLARWAPRMGVPIPDFTIRRMTTRWGTCNIKARRVTLNLELARREPELLEYVVVHELAHLIERGHNARFYAVMDRALPEWRLLRRALNRGGLAGGQPTPDAIDDAREAD